LARLRALAESARGVVLVSAHLGDWESVARAIVAAKIPFVAVGREPYDPRLRAWFDRLRDDTPIIYRGSAGAATRMMRVLKTGGVLGVPMDLRARVPSVPARFFGQLAWTAVGPARLCLRTRAHLVAVSLERTDAGERITCTSIPTLAAPPTGAARDLDARERALTQAINDELERRIRSMPEAWLWPHERFHPSPPLPERARK
jgi:KDO2-lipid IV(A) lauroyltransferase